MVYQGRYRKPLIVLVLLIAVIGLLSLAIISFKAVFTHLRLTNSGTAEKLGSPLPVQVKRAEIGPIESVIGVEALAVESQSIPIRTALKSSKVSNVLVNIGDVVQQGQKLIEFDSTLPKSTLESKKTLLRSAKAQLALSTSQLGKIRRLYDQSLATEGELAKAEQDRIAGEASVAKAEIELAEALQALNETVLHAPVSAVVAEVNVSRGTNIISPVDLLLLKAIDPIHISLELSEDKSRYVYVGQPVEISFYALPDKPYQAKVDLVKPDVDEKSRLFYAIAILKNPGLGIKPGMNAVAHLKTLNQRIRIPKIALLETQMDGAYVFVVDASNIAHIRKIRTGVAGEGYVEVTDGLREGEQVVVVGQSALKDHAEVRLGGERAVP